MSYCAAAAHQLLLLQQKLRARKIVLPRLQPEANIFSQCRNAFCCRLGIVVVIVVPFVVAVVVTACENNFNCGCHFIN